MRQASSLIAAVLLLAFGTQPAFAESEVFSEKDHCVAYRTLKRMFFRFDAEIVGRNCEATASLQPGEADAGARIVVVIPIKGFSSRNFMRDRTVSHLLGVKEQPELRFVSEPLDAGLLAREIPSGRFPLSGLLSIGGRDFPVTFELELFERGDQRLLRGALETTFSALAIEVPTVGPGGILARPGEKLELLLQLDPTRVANLAEWARQNRLQ